MSFLLRDNNRTRLPLRKTRTRSPSSLRSKIQFGSEKRSSVKVVNIGAVHDGWRFFLNFARASFGNFSNSECMTKSVFLFLLDLFHCAPTDRRLVLGFTGFWRASAFASFPFTSNERVFLPFTMRLSA